MLHLQALSIVKFFNREEIGDIVLVANQFCDDETIGYVKERILPIYEMLPGRARLLTWNDLFPGFSTKAPGWYTQQPLKIAASLAVDTDFYLILDCKNHFVRRADISTFFTPEGRIKTSYHNGAPNVGMGRMQDHTFEYLGIDPHRYGGGNFGISTPYGVRTSAMRALMDYIRTREESCLAEAFDRYQWRWAEFYLIFGYLLTQQPDALITDYQPTGNRPVGEIWYGDDGHDVARSLMHVYHQSDVNIMTLHRRSIEMLTPEEKCMISRLWVDVGLVADINEAAYFLSPSGALS